MICGYVKRKATSYLLIIQDTYRNMHHAAHLMSGSKKNSMVFRRPIYTPEGTAQGARKEVIAGSIKGLGVCRGVRKHVALGIGALLLLCSMVVPSGKALAVDFTLSSWEVVNDSGYPGLLLTFDITDDVEMRLNDPDGVEVDYQYVDQSERLVYMHLAGYGMTPKPGTYELLVTPRWAEEIIFRREFTFQGADLFVAEVEMTWDWRLFYEVAIAVENNGDLPAYLAGGAVRIQDEEDSLAYSTTLIMPGEGETITDEVYVKIPSGTYPIDITLTDHGGDIVTSYSGTVEIRDDNRVMVTVRGGCFIGTAHASQ
jgi:hypothetical protein